eukprot:Polyplicarium_translucidae@DN339_c0_g1_i1.p1
MGCTCTKGRLQEDACDRCHADDAVRQVGTTPCVFWGCDERPSDIHLACCDYSLLDEPSFIRRCSGVGRPVKSANRAPDLIPRHPFSCGCATRNGFVPACPAAILADSSVVGAYVMPPWTTDDVDIRNNFWVDTVPPPLAIDADATAPRHAIPTARPSSPAVAAEPPFPPTALWAPSGGHTSTLQTDKGEMCIELKLPQLGEVTSDGWDLSSGCFVDSSGAMDLSDKQRQRFHSWRRLGSIVSATGSEKPCGGGASRRAKGRQRLDGGYVRIQKAFIEPPSSKRIKQGFVGDCSFLSSLAVLAEFELRFKVPIVSQIIHPQLEDEGTLVPVVNPRS